ncbi:MAG: hypothetical protein OK456_08315 [Thaumarchaeota archaeon]|nr:hypothetical protein [Nitrososphaerota archaeon]
MALEDRRTEKVDGPRLGNGPVTKRNVAILVTVMLAAKFLVFFSFYLIANGHFPSPAVEYLVPESMTTALRTISTDWDGLIYQLISSAGYSSSFKASELYAFSPFYPAFVYVGALVTGSYWTSALVVTSLFGFIFPIVLLKIFDLRTALIAELFPVYIVYTITGYSDTLALTFLALALLCYLKGRPLLAGLASALAGLVLYDLFIAAIAFVAFAALPLVRRRASPRQVINAILPLALPTLVAGAAVLVVYQVATGDPFTFFKLERAYWDVALTTPVGQVQWIFNGSGPGSFTDITWYVFGVRFNSLYWVLRNALFEAFFLAGIYMLAKMRGLPQRWLLVGYSTLFTIPLLFVQGTPVYSVPRLLLAAFPVFYGYSARVLNRNWVLALYVVASLVAACWVLISFTFAFFA